MIINTDPPRTVEKLDLSWKPLEGKENGVRYFKVGIVLYECAWLDGFMCVTERGETSDDWDNPYEKEREWAYQSWKEGALAGESYNKHLKKEIRVKEREEIDDRERN